MRHVRFHVPVFGKPGHFSVMEFDLHDKKQHASAADVLGLLKATGYPYHVEQIDLQVRIAKELSIRIVDDARDAAYKAAMITSAALDRAAAR